MVVSAVSYTSAHTAQTPRPRQTVLPLEIRVADNTRILERILKTRGYDREQKLALIAELSAKLPTQALRALDHTDMDRVTVERGLHPLSVPHLFARAADLALVAATTVFVTDALVQAAIAGEHLGLLYGALAAMLSGAAATIGLALRPGLGPTMRLTRRLAGVPGQEHEKLAGFVSYEERAMHVVDLGSSRFTASIAYVFAHELVHVLDLACGGKRPLSQTRGFLKLYDRVVRGHAAGWPTTYAVATSSELFAEAAVIYLGFEAPRALTAAQLRERQPELWHFMDDFFKMRLPKCVDRIGVLHSSHFEDLFERPWLPRKTEAMVRALETSDTDARSAYVATVKSEPLRLADLVTASTHATRAWPAYWAMRAKAALFG